MGSGNDILDMYIFETNTLLEQLESIILEAEKSVTFSQDDVNEIFRIMHTVKGSSAMMEFTSIMTVAHRIEDLFFLIRENSMDVVPETDRPALFDVVFQSIDYFRGEIEKVEAGEPLDKDIDQFLANINSLILKINGGVDEEEAAPPAPEEGAPEADDGYTGGNSNYPYELIVSFEEGSGMESLRAFMLVSAIRDACDENGFIFDPPNVENDPSTSEQIVEKGFLLMFKDKEDRDSAIALARTTGSVKSYQAHNYHAAPAQETVEEPAGKVPEAAAAVETPVSSAASASAASASAASAASAAPGASAAGQHQQKETLISVNLSKLDQLQAVVGEIVITESMVTDSPDLKGLSLDNFNKAARQLRQLTDELQDVSMSLRMVPVSATFQKMNRIVRDMSKKLGKRAKLTLIGENTEVDKTIVDSIGDPIMHMIRNSMDHGIEENEADRVAAGKDPVGEVILSARDTGSEVIIEIIDDGQGVNDEVILKKAIKNGLAVEGMEYSHKEILNFLLMPGFSTNTEVTEYSGRGVGMDVVKRGVEELGGTVTITSELGKGMATTMRIPLTMAIMDGMEVAVGSSTFTIPINNIRSSYKVAREDVIHDATSGEMVKLLDNFYPVIRARDFYHLNEGVTEIEDGILLWLEADNYSFCLLVDELIGEQQVVVKQLPGYVNRYNIKDYGINGCTLLGDGSISIILDVASLYTARYNA